MNQQTLLSIAIAVVIVGWIIYRQNQWRLYDPARMWRAPLIFGIVGAVIFVNSVEVAALGTVDIALLVFEGALSLAVGAVMGAMSQFARDPQGGLLVRTGPLASSLWLVLIVVRIVIDVVAVGYGATAVASAGALVAMLGINRLGRILIISRRVERLAGPVPVRTPAA
ncbi:hypothetical protein [Nocardia arthritidis]|uniref:DUF1453 family protein n=1 Tax=Nocardia arthritidis TaxID=228602 RepID=A0A6G9YV83_9NOCA|nr:hypothetical protein [Nocardia arthritidis]QIS16743.1 hypothetical protein F5544_44700 [Nocardia arthritidis]